MSNLSEVFSFDATQPSIIPTDHILNSSNTEKVARLWEAEWDTYEGSYRAYVNKNKILISMGFVEGSIENPDYIMLIPLLTITRESAWFPESTGSQYVEFKIGYEYDRLYQQEDEETQERSTK